MSKYVYLISMYKKEDDGYFGDRLVMISNNNYSRRYHFFDSKKRIVLDSKTVDKLNITEESLPFGKLTSIVIEIKNKNITDLIDSNRHTTLPEIFSILVKKDFKETLKNNNLYYRKSR